jgi:hypothetical protein
VAEDWIYIAIVLAGISMIAVCLGIHIYMDRGLRDALSGLASYLPMIIIFGVLGGILYLCKDYDGGSASFDDEPYLHLRR